MRKSELRQLIKEEIQGVLRENQRKTSTNRSPLRRYRYLNENEDSNIKNKYTKPDPEDEGWYFLDKKKASEYLSTLNIKGKVNARQFLKDEEDWDEFADNYDNPEKDTDKQVEAAMKEALSYYFFSNPYDIDTER